MVPTQGSALEGRVLILMSSEQDAARTCELLERAGLVGTACRDVDAVCAELNQGAGAILLSDEVISGAGSARLFAALDDQPSWSDVPLIVLTREGVDSRNSAFLESANVTLVERPVRMRTLLSVIQSGLRARNRQYEVRDHLVERQRTAEGILVERERLRVTLASIGDAVISTDIEGRVSFMNPVAEHLTGWSHDEALGQSLADVFRVVHEHSRRSTDNSAVRPTRDGGHAGDAKQIVLIACEGTRRPIDNSVAPIRDSTGAAIGTVLVFRDVTEQRHAEEVQSRLAAIVESSDDAIISKTLDGTIRSWNAGAERLYGYSSSEAVGRPITLIIPPDRLDEERGISDRLRGGERVEHFETVRVAKDGRLLNIALTVSPIRDSAGHIIGASKIARDVTQRTRIEAALRSSEERYRTLFASLGEGFCVIEMLYDHGKPVDYRFLDVNPAFEKHTGLRDVVGRTVRDVVPNHDAHWFENYGRVAATGEPMKFVSQAKALGRWFEVYAYRLGGPESRQVATLFTDITDQMNAEEAIRQRDERIRLFLENAIDYAVVITDPDDHVVEWMGGAERITGWSASEVLGKPVELIFTPEDREAGIPAAETTQATETGLADDTRWHLRRDGTQFFAEGVTVALRGPSAELRGFGKVFKDATSQKLSQDALARDAQLLASVRDSVVVINHEGFVTYWNEGASRLFGWAAEEMVGKNYLSHLPLPTRAFITDQIRKRSPGVEWNGEYHDVCKDGSRIWINVRISSVTDVDGNVVGILIVSHDITERKNAEEALLEADRRKDEFIALLAHELRNPLAPIRNGLQIMRLASDVSTVSQVQGMMERQLSHMVRLIDDLLNVSRINRNKLELRRSRILLSDAVSSAVETSRPAIEAAGHELTVALPDGPVFLDADLTRLSQVFSNLLHNSAKYTESGGRIRLTARVDGDEVTVTVADTGIGIPAEAIPYIFDMFSQVDRTIERSTGGLGIGLALVKGLVEMHGGSVSASSRGINQGSEFSVRLPIIPLRMETPPTETPRNVLGTGPQRRILVVDDNRDSAITLAEMLRLLGNEVAMAHDGIEAVERAGEFRPDVILMDIGMPKLNGMDATRCIRQQAWGRTITIIALTGWGQESDRAQTKEAGCNGHLVKPLSLAELQKLLSELVLA